MGTNATSLFSTDTHIGDEGAFQLLMDVVSVDGNWLSERAQKKNREYFFTALGSQLIICHFQLR